MADKVKRPPKQQREEVILQNFAFLQAGVEGITAQSTKGFLQQGNYFLYKEEVKQLIEKHQEDADFDPELFVKTLKEWDIVKEGTAPRIGGEGTVTINSLERVKQVANNPDNKKEVQQIKSILDEVIELRKQLNPLIDKNASFSYALKNKKPKSDKDSDKAENEDQSED